MLSKSVEHGPQLSLRVAATSATASLFNFHLGQGMNMMKASICFYLSCIFPTTKGVPSCREMISVFPKTFDLCTYVDRSEHGLRKLVIGSVEDILEASWSSKGEENIESF